MYDTAKEPPRPGSLHEILFIMIQMRRELARFHETLVVTQAVRDDEAGDATQKAFETYRGYLMPYLKKQLNEEQERVMQVLREEANKGPLKVTPIVSPSVARSQLKQSLMKAKNAAKYKGGKRERENK